MTNQSLLPFGVLLLAIAIASWLQSRLAGIAVFRPAHSPLAPCERIVRGAQLSMFVLLVIVTVASVWRSPKGLPELYHRPVPEEPAHIMLPNSNAPTAITAQDPLWLQREKRKAMLDWESMTWQEQRRSN